MIRNPHTKHWSLGIGIDIVAVVAVVDTFDVVVAVVATTTACCGVVVASYRPEAISSVRAELGRIGDTRLDNKPSRPSRSSGS